MRRRSAKHCENMGRASAHAEAAMGKRRSCDRIFSAVVIAFMLALAAVPRAEAVKAVAAGESHVCAIIDENMIKLLKYIHDMPEVSLEALNKRKIKLISKFKLSMRND